ncbi:hypothetical protein PSCLAVI8L_130303 [Pseudoclavibacter sp. 8L]|nr:hypothetical protein PSCLAVI8L_130303 [Pseudoclavibacter sp. 8L]
MACASIHGMNEPAIKVTAEVALESLALR